MATTIRLPSDLQAEATRYAQSLGLSLNGIVAVALRDYLDVRRPGAGDAVLPPGKGRPAALPDKPRPAMLSSAPADEEGKGVVPAGVGKVIRAPANRRAPCPCGSGKRYSQCHGREAMQSFEGSSRND
jgi:hypothetical protein